MAFNRVFVNNERRIGFDKKGGDWISASVDRHGVFINKVYLSSEPILSFKQARKFANKILEFCEGGE